MVRTSAPKVKQETSSSSWLRENVTSSSRARKSVVTSRASPSGSWPLLAHARRDDQGHVVVYVLGRRRGHVPESRDSVEAKGGLQRKIGFSEEGTSTTRVRYSGTLQRVADALKRVEFAAGSKIVTEGEPGDDFYLIEDGEVKCTKRNGSEEQHLLTLEKGGLFWRERWCAASYGCLLAATRRRLRVRATLCPKRRKKAAHAIAATPSPYMSQALMLDEPRHATVTSTRPTKCFAISSHDFSRLFGPLRDLIQQQMRMRILKSVPLLSHLDDHALDKLADAMRIQLFDAGKYVIKEGDKGSRFYIINAGAAKEKTISGRRGHWGLERE